MAPPRHRRPGFSRRAQYGLFAGYVAAVVGILVGVGLVVAARFDPQGFSLLRGAAVDAASPVAGAGRSATGALGDLGSGIAAYWDAGSQNAALRRELARARTRLIEAEAREFENRRLRRLARLVEVTPQEVVTARIIGSSASSTRRVATLAAGSLQGVRPGEPVRAAEGLVGRVIETGHFSARVLLLTDPGSTVPVRLVRSGVPALASGRGDGTIDLRALASGLAPFRRGDLLVTSGTGGVYPPDVPVAVVTSVSRDSASAWPLADPAALDYAVVLRSFEPDLSPAARARQMKIAPADPAERALRLPARARIVPVATVMLASALPAMLPLVAEAPLLPPLGLLVLLGWRLLRPELWQAWVALPLGLWDDLFSGQPAGSAATLWTTVLLVLDFTDNRTVWHDYWHDLLAAAAALAFCLAGGWVAAGAEGGFATIPLLLAQLAFSLLAMPLAVRLVARLDRFRLAR